MPFTLFAPGTRKNNPFWVARISVDGQRVERSLATTNKTEAKIAARNAEAALLTAGVPKRGDLVSFAKAARFYAAFRGLDLDNPQAHRGQKWVEVKALARLIAELGKRPVAEIGQPELVAVANRLYPGRPAVRRAGKLQRPAAPHSQATKNRWVIKPGAAVVHYAVRQKLCSWERIEKFREKRQEIRAVSTDTAAELVAAAPAGPRRLLLVWLFRQGTRITDTLQLRWEVNINLRRQSVRLRIGKADDWTELTLQAEVFEMLAAILEAERQGRLFPWETRSGVYSWLRPLARERLGVAFTPHMARHSVGTWLNEEGAGLRTIMAALFHRDPQSSIRYQTADVEIVRAASRGFAPITGKRAADG